jgi:hypothetical protein
LRTPKPEHIGSFYNAPSHIKEPYPKRQRLQDATTKYVNIETQNYLLGGDPAPWAAGSSYSPLSYAYTVIHKQAEGLQVKWKEKIQ